MEPPKPLAAFTESLRNQLLSECRVMLQYALSSGRQLPQSIRDALGALDQPSETAAGLAALAELHAALLRVVAPATPGGLSLIQDDRRLHRQLHMLGPVPSIRYLMAAAAIFAVLFFATSLSHNISTETVAMDIFNSAGAPLAWVLVFLLSASGLGATFGALFDAYENISDGSYDSRFDSVYWARIGLGLVSGLMLAELIPQSHSSGTALERPLLALLGGFSAAVVHRILERLAGALESVFVPTAKLDPAATEREIRQRVAEEQALQRTMLAKSFDQLLDQVASGASVGEARKGLVALLSGKPGAAEAPAGKDPPDPAAPPALADATGNGGPSAQMALPTHA